MAQKQIGDYKVKISADTEGLKQDLGGLPKLIGAAFAADALLDFTKKVIEVQAEFQRYEAVLSNTLGSSLKAQVALKDLTKIASETPFAVNTLTDAYIRLANQGFIPTRKEIIKLGDLASSTGKDFLQLTEAIIDAQVGEFERLKEFGIRASKSGDQVKFTFKGVETQVDNSEEAIRGYILALGDAEGVSGAMAKISETTGGKISNLGDNMTGLFKAIGDADSGLISGVLELSNIMLSGLVSSISAVNTVAEKTSQNGFMAFLSQMRSLVDPVYAMGLQQQAMMFDALDKQAAEASETIQKTTDAEKKKIEEIKAVNDSRRKASAEFYAESIKMSAELTQSLAIETEAFLGLANIQDRFQKRIMESRQFKNEEVVDIGLDLGPEAPLTETADVFQEDADKINNSLFEMLVNADVLSQAFSGLGSSIVGNMDGASTAFKAFLSTFISGVGKYIAQTIAIQMADKKKAAGKMVNIAADSAELAGPFAAFVFPAILAGLLGLISGVFGGGVGGGGGGRGGQGPRSESTKFSGSQANASLRDSLTISGSITIDNGDKLSILVKNQELKKGKI
jgi:hypothetical protein